MTNSKLAQNTGLLKAFREYRKRYLSVGKKPNMIKFLPNDLYHTMRLEGEKITRRQVQLLFK